MKLKTNKNKTNRMINNGNYIKKGTRTTTRVLNRIHYSPLRTTERAFNSIPRRLRNMTGVKVNTFKKHLDRWMLQIPDLPKCKGYQGYTAANSNAIYDQVMVRGWACDRLAICQWKTLAVNPNKEHKEHCPNNFDEIIGREIDYFKSYSKDIPKDNC